MRYIGGKNRIAKDIVPIILQTNPDIVVEPFCGALNVTVELIKQKPGLYVFASDNHCDLIEMWKAIQNGWLPPLELDREEYNALKLQSSSVLRTFAGYGCSFSGKWFGGYANDKTNRNYCLNARNSILKKVPYLKNVIFSHGDYSSRPIPKNSIVYCDPPYFGTTKVGEGNSFDHKEFWQWVNSLKVECYVSEYVAPHHFQVIWEKQVKTDMNTKDGNNTRTEKLFCKSMTKQINSNNFSNEFWKDESVSN